MHTLHQAIVLIAHGSRESSWLRPIEAVRERLQAQQPQRPVRCAYLQLCSPDLAGAVQELAAIGATHITLTPLFFGTGRHVREDLPRQVKALARTLPHLHLHLQPPMSEDERLLALMAHIASESPFCTI